MPRFLNDVDLDQNQLLNAVVHKLTSAPSTPVEGQVYYNTIDGVAYLRDDSAFRKMLLSGQVVNADIASGAGIAYSKLDLAGGIVNADIAPGAAIAYGKLNLAGSVGASDIADSLKPSGTADAGTEALRALGTSAGQAMPGTHSLAAIAAANASAAPITASNQKIVNVAPGENSGDAVNYGQLTALAAGLLDYKESCRAVATTDITLEDEQTIDDVAVVAGDRVLVAGQADPTENGIYVVVDGGAWTRSEDADEDPELSPGAFLAVEEGTDYANTLWLLVTVGPVELGVTELDWMQLPTLNDLVAGDGLTKTGNTLNVGVVSGSGLVVNADDLDVDPINGLPISRGGTGAVSVAGAKANLGFPIKYAETIGDGVETAIGVNHNIGTRDVIVTVYDLSTFEQVFPDVEHTTSNTVTISFAEAPDTDAYRVVVIG